MLHNLFRLIVPAFFVFISHTAHAEVAVTFFFRITPLTRVFDHPGFENEMQPLHAFLRFQGFVDGKPIDEVYGFFPSTKLDMLKSVFSHRPGSILDSKDKPGGRGSETWNSSYPAVSVTVPDERYKELMGAMDAWKADKEGYFLWSRNCVSFADHLARMLNLVTPVSPDLLPANYMRQLEDLNPDKVFTSKEINEHRFGKPLTPSDLKRLRELFKNTDKKVQTQSVAEESAADLKNTVVDYSKVEATRQAVLARDVRRTDAKRVQEVTAAQTNNNVLSKHAVMSEEQQKAAIESMERSFDKGDPVGDAHAPVLGNDATSNFDPSCEFTNCVSTSVPSLADMQARLVTPNYATVATAPGQQIHLALPRPALFLAYPSASADKGWRYGDKQIVYLGHVQVGDKIKVLLQTAPSAGDGSNLFSVQHSKDITVSVIQSGQGSATAFNPPADLDIQIQATDNENTPQYIAFYDNDHILVSTVFFDFDSHTEPTLKVKIDQNVASGYGKDFSDWYTLPSGLDPIGYKIIGYHWYVRNNDDGHPRACESWSECEVRFPNDGSGFAFRLSVQGHDGGGGIIHDQKEWFFVSAHLDLEYALKRTAPVWLENAN